MRFNRSCQSERPPRNQRSSSAPPTNRNALSTIHRGEDKGFFNDNKQRLRHSQANKTKEREFVRGTSKSRTCSMYVRLDSSPRHDILSGRRKFRTVAFGPEVGLGNCRWLTCISSIVEFCSAKLSSCSAIVVASCILC